MFVTHGVKTGHRADVDREAKRRSELYRNADTWDGLVDLARDIRTSLVLFNLSDLDMSRALALADAFNAREVRPRVLCLHSPNSELPGAAYARFARMVSCAEVVYAKYHALDVCLRNGRLEWAPSATTAIVDALSDGLCPNDLRLLAFCAMECEKLATLELVAAGAGVSIVRVKAFANQLALRNWTTLRAFLRILHAVYRIEGGIL